MWPLDLLHDSAWRPLTWTLLHFLWQGIAVASVWKVLFWVFQGRRTQIHYLLGLAGLLVMAACPAVTLLLVESDPGQVETKSGFAAALAEHVPDVPQRFFTPTTSMATPARLPAVGWDVAPSRIELAQAISAFQPYLLCGWIMGLVLMSSRLLCGAVGAHRLGRGRQAVPGELADRAAILARRMGLGWVPDVFLSGAARESLVTGFLWPMVLLPAAWLAEMTPEVLEAVIAHELAHIRRFDVWINLFQRFLETLLFYHPAVWWLSHRVRLAREMCCDELAAGATGERVVYASALELVARKRLVPASSFLEVALGVTRMTLLKRVRNVLGLAAQSERGRWWPAAVLALLVPPAVWLVSTAAVTSGQEQKPALETKNAEGDTVVRPAAGAELVPGRAEKPARRPKAAVPAGSHPKYTASAYLMIRMQERPIAFRTDNELSDASAHDRFEIYKRTQQQLITMRLVLVAALRNPTVAKLPSIRHAQETGDPVKWLQSRLRVSFPGNAEIMEVSLTADDPDEAATLVREVVDTYMREIVNAQLEQKRQRLSELDRAFTEKEQEIRSRRKTLKKLASELGTSATEALTTKQKFLVDELGINRQELAKVQAELRCARGDLAAWQAVLKSVETVDITDAEVDSVMQSDPIGRELFIELGWKKLDQLYMDNAVVKFPGSRYVDRYQQALKTLQESYNTRKAELVEVVRQKRRSLVQSEVRKLESSLAALVEQERHAASESRGEAGRGHPLRHLDRRHGDAAGRYQECGNRAQRARLGTRQAKGRKPCRPTHHVDPAVQKPEMPDDSR